MLFDVHGLETLSQTPSLNQPSNLVPSQHVSLSQCVELKTEETGYATGLHKNAFISFSVVT